MPDDIRLRQPSDGQHPGDHPHTSTGARDRKAIVAVIIMMVGGSPVFDSTSISRPAARPSRDRAQRQAGLTTAGETPLCSAAFRIGT